jgi:NAD-dependent SIR2 family protein deacetylase
MQQLNMIDENFWEKELLNQQIIDSVEFRKLQKIFDEKDRRNNLLIFAGSGMSQNSGLPVFSGGLVKDKNQKEIIELFDNAIPHEGYKILMEMCKGKNYYILTSNIDGYFERVGFDPSRIIEIHGNINYSQCNNKKCYSTHTPRYTDTICEYCNQPLVPNVFTGGFHNFIDKTKNIEDEMEDQIKLHKFTIIEIGAGLNIPVIQDYSEILVEQYGFPLIRINPIEYGIPVDILSEKTCRIPYDAITGISIVKNILCIY